LPLEIKNVAGNQNKFEIALKKIIHLFFLHNWRVLYSFVN